MEIIRAELPASRTDADAVVVGVYQGQSPDGAAAEVDRAYGGAVSRLMERQEITGKRNELTPLLAPPGVAAAQVLVVGLGRRERLDRGAAFEICGAAAKKLAEKPRDRVAFFVGDGWTDDRIESGVCGAIVGCQGQDLYRAEKKLHPFPTMLWSSTNDAPLRTGQILGESVNFARRLVNGPPSDVYPESFARAAADVADQCGLEVEVWDERRLEAERCGALLAVAQGSARGPRMVLLRYRGGPPGSAPLAFVGKGVTFDSGGLSLKPTDGMLTMKCDMAGAATVLAAIWAVARLELPVNVVALAGLAENMVSGSSYKLGDVLTARNGRTIEVHNTDAEGRLVLADVLSLAVDLGVSRIVDLATLTGACMVALGTDVAGLMTNDQAWLDRVRAAADGCGEMAWQLPMFEHYGEQIKGEVADVKNVGDGRWGGAITAAKFLEEFVGQTPWTHIDIAGPAFRDKPKPWCDAGGSGQFVRTLVELARQWAI